MKGRKLLSAIIAGAMVLGTMSFPAFAASDTLPEAVNGVITLTDDVTLAETLRITSDTTIDLASFNITSADVANSVASLTTLIDVKGATLTIIGAGTIEPGSRTNITNYNNSFYTISASNGATVVIDGATVKGSKGINTKYGGTAVNASMAKVTIQNGAKIYGGDCEKNGITSTTYENYTYRYQGEAGDAVSAQNSQLTVTDSYIYGGNGTADADTQREYISGGPNFAIGGLGIYVAQADTIAVVSNSTVKGGDSTLYNAENAVCAVSGAKLAVEDCTITGGSCLVRNDYGIAGAGISVPMGKCEVTVTGSNVTGGNTDDSWIGSGIDVPRNAKGSTVKVESSVIAAGSGDGDSSTAYAIETGTPISVELKDTTLKANEANGKAVSSATGSVTAEGTLTVESGTLNTEVFTNGGVTVSGDNSVVPQTIVAKIGNTNYASLQDAITAANNGDTIDLLDNTIALDGQTTIDKNITITNGTFDITDAVCAAEGIIYIYDSSVEFNNVDLIGSNFKSAFGVIYANHNADVTLDNCDFTLKNDLAPSGGTLKGNDNASFTVKNCTFDLENPSRVLTSITLDMSDTTINAYVTDPTRVAGVLNNHAFRNVYGEIKDSTIDVTGTETGLKNTARGSLSITGTSNVSFTNTVDNNIYLADDNETFTVAPTATLNGEVVYGTVSEATITDEIAVNFVPTADENVYDIVLDGNYKEIYEFVSAEIQFINAGNGYEIDGTDDINVIANTDHPDRYGFYLKDGAVGNRKTATKIKIGTVTFPAYGTINFKVDANNSKVVATEYNTHIEKYYTAADENAKLTADVNGITGTIEAPTRDVAINVAYAHALVGSWTDNQMTVALKNAFGETSAPQDISDGLAEFADVPVGRITVTLKAPGFRTFTYTTTVEEGTDPLVLSFWNDTKRDTTAEVEPGKAMANNFVVGDIAMDYIVDKYDLAAVTSYYGTYGLADVNKIKYDLNRDGNIDITDVAYVLHNFGF